jgi:hemolysin activation/secretion protein
MPLKVDSFMSNLCKPYLKLVGVAVLGCVTHLGVGAQQAVPEATGATSSFAIRGFELTGDIPLASSETTRVLAPFIGPGATLETLQKATSALEAELKAKGYALHRVSLPPQEVGSKVTLNIVKFVIGKITVQGTTRYSDANIRASVPELREGEAPNFNVLAVQTTIANENTGKQMQVALKESDEADKIDVNLQVNEAPVWTASAGLANTGSESTGHDRLSLVLGHANVLDRDHQFSAAFTTSVERTQDVKQLGLNYRIPLYQQGGVLSLSYTNSDVVGNFGTFTSGGAGQTMGANYSHYFAPTGGRRTYLTLGLDEKIFDATKLNGEVIAGQLTRGSRPLTLGYTARVEADTATWGYNAELATNVPGSSGNNLAAYQTEDPRIEGVNWTVLRGGVNYLSTFGEGWLWSGRAQFQASSSALISGEQFGLGGATSVRGTGERVISGDSGLAATLEVNTPELAPGLRLLGFVDAGWLRSNNTDLNPNKAPADQLGSVGLGLRYAAGAFGLSAEWGRVLSGPTVTGASSAASTKAGDDRLHVNLTARF